MRLVDLHVPTSRQSLELNPDFQSLAATQAKRTAASDLRHCATRAGKSMSIFLSLFARNKQIGYSCNVRHSRTTWWQASLIAVLLLYN